MNEVQHFLVHLIPIVYLDFINIFNCFIYFIDEYTREKSQPTKIKKRAKKRPQSASAAGSESVRLNNG